MLLRPSSIISHHGWKFQLETPFVHPRQSPSSRSEMHLVERVQPCTHAHGQNSSAFVSPHPSSHLSRKPSDPAMNHPDDNSFISTPSFVQELSGTPSTTPSQRWLILASSHRRVILGLVTPLLPVQAGWVTPIAGLSSRILLASMRLAASIWEHNSWCAARH